MRHRILAVGLVVVLAVSGLALAVQAQSTSKPPSSAAIAFATRTSNLLLATLFAALTQEFDETTPQNVEEGKLSIGLVFSDEHSNFRLVGTQEPLSENDLPMDAFEETALASALTGAAYTNVERVGARWLYRRSIPLSNFRAECSLCHANFGPVNTSQWVGALMLKVPISKE